MVIIYKKLFKILIDKDMKKGDLQKAAGISWASVTKLSKGESVSMEVLMKICHAWSVILETFDDASKLQRWENILRGVFQ